MNKENTEKNKTPERTKESEQIKPVIGCDSGWIKCADRLPDIKLSGYSNDCLLVDTSGAIDIGFMSLDEDNKPFWGNYDNDGKLLYITYWMLLPKSPNHCR